MLPFGVCFVGLAGGSCAPGYEGVLCTRCSAGYYRVAGERCVECPERSSGALAALFIVLTVVVVAAVAAVLCLRRNRLKEAAATHKDQISAAAALTAVRAPSMLATFFQVIAVLGKVRGRSFAYFGVSCL